MATGNNIQVSLNLKDSQFKRGIENAGQQLQTLVGAEKFVKLKLDANDFRSQYQTALKDAMKGIKRVGANTYKASNGKTAEVNDAQSAAKAYARFTELAKSASSTKEQNTYIAKANAVGKYLQSLSELGNKMKEVTSLEQRMNRATNTGMVAAQRRQSYKDALTPEREANAADRRFRNKQMEGLRQKDKAEAAEQKAAERAEKERNKRYSKNVQEYDKQIKAGTDTMSPELFRLHNQYLNGKSNFQDSKKSVTFEGANAQIENLKARLAELQKIFDQLGTPKTKGEKRYFAQIEGEIQRVKAELEPLLKIQEKLNTNATPTVEQSKWSMQQEEKQRREANKNQAQASVFNDKNAYILEGYDKKIAKIRKQIVELNKTALNPSVSANTLQQIERLKQEMNRLKQQKAELQEDPKITTRAYRDAYHTNRRQYAEQDRQMNRMTNGGNSNIQLAQMRAFYREQERVAASAAREQERAAERNAKAQERVNAKLERQGGLLGRLKTLAASYLSIFTAYRYIRGLVDTTGYFEQQQVALEGILGSASAATKAISQLKSMALQSPKQFKDLVGDAKQLSAYGIEVEKLLPTVKQLADISVGLGVDMGRLTLAYGQVKSATVLRGQELRQFTEAGVPMVEELAKKFTQLNGKLVSTSEIFELISKRQVSFEMVAEVLRDMTAEGGKFYNMQETISETLYGQVQKLKDLWTINLNDTGSSISGVLMGGVKALQLLIKESRTLLWVFGAAGIMVGVKSLATGFGTIKRRIEEIRLTTALWKMELRSATGLAGKAGLIFKGIGAALTSNIGIAAISALVGLIAKAVIKSKELSNELGKIDKSFAKDNAKYIQGFDKLIGKLSLLTEGTKKYNETLDTLKNNYSDYVNPAIINQLIAERKQLDDTAEGWGRLHDSIVAAINAKNDYERHKAKKEKAGDMVTADVPYKLDIMLGNLRAIADRNTYKGRKIDTNSAVISSSLNNGEDVKKTKDALSFAIESFFSQGLISEAELQDEIERSFKTYGVTNVVTKFVLENIDTIWKNLTNTEKWQTYLDEHNAAENSDYAKIDRAFNDAQKRTSQRQEGRWQEGMTNEEYKPTKLIQAGQYDITIATQSLIAGITQEIQAGVKNGNTEDIFVSEDGLDDGKKGLKLYNEAANVLNKEFKGITIDTFQDADKINRIAQALNNLGMSIKDSNLLNRISDITGKFTELAGVKSGQAAQVSTNITRDFLDSGVLSHDVKDWYAQYVNKTTNETFDSVREGIRTLYQENKKYIDSYSKSPIGANKEEVERRKAENARLEKLAATQYYDIDLTDKKKGRSAYNHNKEYDEFLNEFKSAYDMYKKAIQQGGVSMGAAFVQNNKQVQDMFGGFFNGGEFGDKFKQVKVGDKSVIDLMQDKFISDGIEKGIVDFKGAAEAVAAELKEQADNHKGTAKGQDYLQEYNALTKWIQSTFSKDNIDGFLKDLEKSLNDLTLTFDKTNKNVELYSKMIEKGTQVRHGSMIGAQYKAQVTTPQSTIMKGNIQKVVEVYNTKLDEEATSNPESAIAKTKNEQGLYEGYSFGKLDTIDDIYKALQQIDKLEQVNNENFTASAAGQITISKLRPMLQQLLQQVVAEISSISGKKYTGNALNDSVANTKIDMNAAKLELDKAQEISLGAGNGFDYSAIEAYVGRSQTNATAIMDNFLAQNDFSVMFDALGKWKLINFDDLRKKLEELTKNLDPLTKLQLTQKFNDLEQKVNEFNSSTGGNLFNSMHDYFTADKRAKGQYDETVAAGQSIAGAHFDEETGQFSWIKNMVSAEDVATLTVLNAKLKEMGVNGENLSRSFKTEALKNMEASIQSFSKKFNSMTNIVDSVVNAMKAFSNAINEVYDVMNDGENPEWMQVMDDSINDFGEAFEAIIAPIVAVIALVAALAAAAITLDIAFTPLLIIMIAIIAVAAAIAAIVAAFKAHDNALERSIESMKEAVEDFDTAITNLNAAAERATGLDKLVKRTDAVGKSISKASEYANMAAAEDAKKNTDYDKLKEYQQEQQEAEDEFKNSLLDMLDELVSSTEDWANAMGDAIRSAFQNGENAARSFRNTVKTMIGDVVENMLEMAILQPLIESAIQDWTNQDYLQQKYTKKSKDANGNTIDVFDSEGYTEELLKNINNSAKAEDFYKTMIGIGNTLIDTENALPDFLQEALWYNSDTQSLSGGIESITEDTARRLEALSNSQLGALLNIQSILQNYIGGNGMYSSSPMANIQSTIALIQGDTAGIRSATQNLLDEIRAVRTTNSQPLHVSIV